MLVMISFLGIVYIGFSSLTFCLILLFSFRTTNTVSTVTKQPLPKDAGVLGQFLRVIFLSNKQINQPDRQELCSITGNSEQLNRRPPLVPISQESLLPRRATSAESDSSASVTPWTASLGKGLADRTRSGRQRRLYKESGQAIQLRYCSGIVLVHLEENMSWNAKHIME